jgi:hypothetical protein
MRGTGITAYLVNGGTLDAAQRPAIPTHARRNCTTADAIRCHWMMWSGLAFDKNNIYAAHRVTHAYVEDKGMIHTSDENAFESD